MRPRISYSPLSERRLLSLSEATEYTSMGKSKFAQWAMEIGAVRRFGRMVRYDRRVIDAAIDSAGSKTE